MAAELWRERFRQRVVEAERRCSQVLGLITAAQGHLAEQVYATSGPLFMFGGDSTQLAEEALRNAGNDLSMAMYELGAAKALALRGGAVIPSMPLPSIHRLYDKDRPLWSSVGKVRDAMAKAEDANAHVEICCDHLLVIRLLLGRPRLPGVDGLINSERLIAVDALGTALEAAQDSAHLTAGALQDLAGGDGGGSGAN